MNTEDPMRHLPRSRFHRGRTAALSGLAILLASCAGVNLPDGEIPVPFPGVMDAELSGPDPLDGSPPTSPDAAAESPPRDAAVMMEPPRPDIGSRDGAPDVGPMEVLDAGLLPADGAPPDAAPAPPVPLARWVILLAGQSNMVGLGRVAQLAPADRDAVDDVLIYYNASVHAHPQARVWRPLGPGFGATEALFGPELGLARALRARWPDRPLAFIKVAEGGTGLYDRWSPGQDLFQLFVGETRRALAQLDDPHQVVGMAWMQGESDAIEPANAQAYLNRFAAFVHQVREELDHYALPLVTGLIRPNAVWPHAAHVRQAMTLCATGLGNLDVVETADLDVHPDDVYHYDTPSTLALGVRFAEALADLLSVRDSRAAFGPQGEGAWFKLATGPGGDRVMSYDADNDWWTSNRRALIGRDFLHPGTDGDVALLRWIVPLSGEYEIAFDATHVGERGDGVIVDVTLPGDQALIPPGTHLLHDGISAEARVEMRQGDRVDVTAAAGGDRQYDTVEVQVTPTLIRAF